MILDGADPESRKLLNGTVYDICIVGAGAVGFAMAQRLANSGKMVIVLESGKKNIENGWSPPQRPQWWQTPRWIDDYTEIRDLDNAAPIDQNKPPFWYQLRSDFFTSSRTRCYGGSTNCWGGFIRPLDEYDFKSWPIQRKDLESYYQQALQLVKLDHFELFDKPESWRGLTYEAVDVLDSEWLQKAGLKTVVLQLQTETLTTDFQEQFGRIFENTGDGLTLARNATALTFGNGVKLLGKDNHVSSLTCGSVKDNDSRGTDFQVSAKHYVLAMGGLEIPRFLLNNAFDEKFKLQDIGRFYMNHPKYSNVAGARLNGWTWYPEVQRFYSRTVPLCKSGDRTVRTPAEVQAFIVPTEEALSKKHIGNFRMAIGFNPTNPSIVFFDFNFEQSPNDNSRLSLVNTSKDFFGQPRLKLDWQFTPRDAATVNEATGLIKTWLQSLGEFSQWYNMEWNFDANKPYPPTDLHWQPYTGDHHMGTCRMRPTDGKEGDGVVDSDCKVFGFENLWICSTAVYPSGGWANATFTLLALALRLADHLKRSRESARSSTEDPLAKTTA